MTAKKWGNEERRRFKRVSVNFDVLFRVDNPPDLRVKMDERDRNASMLNISEGGVAFVTDGQLPEASEVELHFNLVTKDGKTRPITAVGQVRYCIELADRQMNRVGIEFTKIEEKDKQAIVDFVKSTSGAWLIRFLRKEE